MTQLNVSTSAVSAWGEQLSSLRDAVGNVISGAPGTAGIESSHGQVAFPTQNAFRGAYSARGDALGATQVASGMIGDLLRQAAQAYDRGDSGRLRAQADHIAGGSSPRSPAAGGSGGDQGGGTQAASQTMGQFSQVAGQVLQGATQPVQGIMQGMSQMSQQVVQGVQGIVQTATQAADGGATADAEAAAPVVTAATAGAAPTEAAGPDSRERAPVDHGIMSEERMREMQGLPIHGEDHGDGPVTKTQGPSRPFIPFAPNRL